MISMSPIKLVAIACALLGASACKDKVSAPVARIGVFVDRHAPHMRAIATEMAARCPAALASASPDGKSMPPGVTSSEPPTSIPFGSLVSDGHVLQVAVTCSRDGKGGPIVASLRDPFAEGAAVLPPDGCTEYELPGRGDNDVMKACVDENKPTLASIVLRRPIDGGIIEVFTSFRLRRK
jgi:hypothetical protein